MYMYVQTLLYLQETEVNSELRVNEGESFNEASEIRDKIFFIPFNRLIKLICTFLYFSFK